MRLLVSFLVVLTLAAPTGVRAQTFRGGVQGAVTDTTGAALPGANVTATNEATGLARSAVSDAEGNYFLSELPPGAYSVTAALSGFTTQTVSGVRVEVSQNQRVDIRLAVGQLTQTVQVSAGAALVDATHNTQGDTIRGEQAARLPVNGRDFTKLLSLVPGSTADPSGINDSPGSFGLFRINGNRGRSNNYLLDGTDMNDGYRNLPAINQGGVFGTPSTILPIDAVAEFPILSGVEAEYGRQRRRHREHRHALGRAIRVSGSAFEYFRNDALGARNYFNTEPNPKNPFRNNQFGGSRRRAARQGPRVHLRRYEGQRENGGLPALGARAHRSGAGGGDRGQRRHRESRHRGPAAAAARGPLRTAAPDAERGTTCQATTPLRQPCRQPHRQDRRALRRQRSADGPLLYGDSEQGFPLALLGGGDLPGYNTVTPTNVQPAVGVVHARRVVEDAVRSARRDSIASMRRSIPEDRDFDPSSIGLEDGVECARFRAAADPRVGLCQSGRKPVAPARAASTPTRTLVGSVSYNTGRHN